MERIEGAGGARNTARRPHAQIAGDDLLSAIEALLDPAVLVASLWVVALVYEGQLPPAYLILAVIVFSITFPGTSRLQFSVRRVITDVVFTWTWIAGLLLLTGVATRYIREFDEAAVLTWLWAAPTAQIGAHLLLRVAAPWVLALQGPAQRAVIVGMNDQGLALAGRIADARYTRMQLLGFFDDRARDRLTGTTDHALLGKLADLPRYARENRVQLIYLSLPMASQPRILSVLSDLKDTTASIYFVPDMFVTDLIQGRSGQVYGMPVISVCETPFRGANGVIKRLSDLVLATLILVLMLPVMLLIALAIKLDSRGPVIFKQRRYGLDGEEIQVYKFRSMSVTEDGAQIVQVSRNDARVTHVGAFLRRTSLDELPQFVNVLQGRMSIVGPRPHAVAHNEMYRKLITGYMLRHKVRPGITGWAQVNGFRGETRELEKMKARVDYDLDYLRNWSLALDLRIIIKTVLVVFRDQGAY
ncbi:MAG: undecaprenyl-phosphate glucose phosphotransferase [Burkholderiales bacterium]